MRKFLTSIGAAAVTLLLSSCFELGAVLVINKDGSGVVEETMLMSAQMKAMMASAPKDADGGGGASMSLLTTKEKSAEKATKMGEGVTVKSYEEIKSPDGREGVKIVYAFKDVNKLKYEPGDMKEDKKDQSFAFSAGTLTITQKHDKKAAKTEAKGDDAMPKPTPEQMEQQMAMMKPMMAGMKMSFKVKAANGIASTDATHVDGGTITLMDINFDKVLATPDGMKKFAATADNKDMSPADAAEALKGVDGVKIEAKEKVTVKLK